MQITRRAFTKVALVTGSAILGGGAWVFRSLSPARSTPGPLEDSTAKALMSMATAITGVTDLKGHYLEYYRHYSETVPGLPRDLREFRLERSREGHEAGRCRLRRMRIGPASADSGLDETERSPRSYAGAQGKTGTRFRRRDLPGETLAIFVDTDAWLQLGYPNWRGRSGGLENYRRPPGT